jgi:pimeloyl-ACP methyl ester carboxylesterase
VLDLAAEARGLPEFVTDVAMVVSELRAGISFDALDQVARAAELTVPVLLIHGTEDSTVPIATSEAFARARPDLVTFEAYAEAVTGFLAKV